MDKNRHVDYYEAIVQIRPKDNDVLEFIKKEVSLRKGVTIAKVIEEKYGYDVYISSQYFARSSLARKLKNRFNGEVTISRKLHHQDRMTRKLLYRATILFKLKPKEEPSP